MIPSKELDDYDVLLRLNKTISYFYKIHKSLGATYGKETYILEQLVGCL